MSPARAAKLECASDMADHQAKAGRTCEHKCLLEWGMVQGVITVLGDSGKDKGLVNLGEMRSKMSQGSFYV